eukprot:gene2624-3821_t
MSKNSAPKNIPNLKTALKNNKTQNTNLLPTSPKSNFNKHLNTNSNPSKIITKISPASTDLIEHIFEEEEEEKIDIDLVKDTTWYILSGWFSTKFEEIIFVSESFETDILNAVSFKDEGIYFVVKKKQNGQRYFKLKKGGYTFEDNLITIYINGYTSVDEKDEEGEEILSTNKKSFESMIEYEILESYTFKRKKCS